MGSKNPQLSIRVSHYELSKFQRLSENGVTVRSIFEKLCERCTGMEIAVINSDGERVVIHTAELFTKRTKYIK